MFYFFQRKMHKIKGEPLGRICGSPMHYFPTQLSPSIQPPFTLHRGQFYPEDWSYLDSMNFSDWNEPIPENPPSLATPDREPVPDSPYRESYFIPSNPNVTPPPAHSPFKYVPVRKNASAWIDLDPDLI